MPWPNCRGELLSPIGKNVGEDQFHELLRKPEGQSCGMRNTDHSQRNGDGDVVGQGKRHD